jgi:hypothetical protein
MAKITINRADGQVTIDGVTRKIDCGSLPSYVSVIQWSDDASAGWIEFVNDGHGAFLPNARIVDFAPYQYLRDAWTGA